jgi:hypothetical protein
MRSVTHKPVYLTQEYRLNQDQKYARYLFVTNRVKGIKDMRNDEEEDLLNKKGYL